MKKLFIILVLSAALLFSSCSVKTETTSYAMDTFLTQELYGNTGSLAAEQNEKTVLEIENAVSSHLPASQISKLNEDGAGTLDGIAGEIFSEAVSAAESTGGAFDPSLGNIIDLWDIDGGSELVPSEQQISEALSLSGCGRIETNGEKIYLNGTRIDLGGIAKGYALDRMAENCRTSGIESGLIDFGGSIAAIGNRPDGSKWTVGIKDPNSQGGVAATVKLSDAFVSTSGIYERYFEKNGKIYHHIFDPETGKPVDNGLAGVSVVSDSGILTDIMSTALFAMGADKGLAYSEDNSIAAVFISKDGEISVSTAMGDYGFEKRGQ